MRRNLINTRKNKGLTQVEIAKTLNVTARHYQDIEAGTSDGSIKLWKQLARFFDTTIDLLEQDDSFSS